MATASLPGSGQLQPICRMQDVLLLLGCWAKVSFASGQDAFCFRARGGEGDQLLAMFSQGLKARLFWRRAEKAGSGWTGRVRGGMTKASATRNSTKS